MIAQASMFETEPAESAGREVPAEANGHGIDGNVYLIGRPTLKRFLRFMRYQAVNGASLDEGALIDEWRAASDHIRCLEKIEAGIADGCSMAKLAPNLEPLRAELLKDPFIVQGFNSVPTDIGMVELDRLVVYQKHIDLSHVTQLKKKLGPKPTEEEIFRFCLPSDHPQPPVKWSRAHHDTYVFVSPSSDIRFLGVMPLEAGQITNYPPPGVLAGVVGLAVGFGSNFLNAVWTENRLVLHNGSHRAYALRDLGITHAPCIVQYASSREELEIVGSGDLREHPELYLQHPRPSMLKDYFDPKLRKITQVYRRLHQITVKFEVSDSDVPAL